MCYLKSLSKLPEDERQLLELELLELFGSGTGVPITILSTGKVEAGGSGGVRNSWATRVRPSLRIGKQKHLNFIILLFLEN